MLLLLLLLLRLLMFLMLLLLHSAFRKDNHTVAAGCSSVLALHTSPHRVEDGSPGMFDVPSDSQLATQIFEGVPIMQDTVGYHSAGNVQAAHEFSLQGRKGKVP